MTENAGPSIFSRLPDSYSEHPDLLKWVKADPCGPLGRIFELVNRGTVLDVGAGAGILGRLLKENPDVQADGIDPAIAADNPGVRHYRRYDQCMLEDILSQPRIRDYDWFIFADVIEHMPFPDINLKALVAAAAPTAKFVISTPNVCHNSVRLGLLNGEFEYSKSGILESTHMRFFNIRSLSAVLAASGLKIDRLLCLNRDHYPDALDRMTMPQAAAALFAMAPTSYPMTYQFLAVCSIGSGEIGSIEPVGTATQSRLFREHLKRRYGHTPIGKAIWK